MAAAVSGPPPLPSSAPPPASSQRRSSTGILHNVKRAVFGPNKSATEDSEFQTTQADFQTLHQLLRTLQSNAKQYTKAALTLATAARATTRTFAELIQDAARPNPYSGTLLSSTQAHNEWADKVEEGGVYTRDMLSVVEQQYATHQALMARIEERTRLRQDYLYYDNKVTGLQKEREERQLKGKVDKAADVEKMERNNAKLGNTGDRYRLFNAELMHDLQMLYLSRLKTYGPCLRQFVSAEKKYSSDFYACMSSVDREQGGGAASGAQLSNGLSIYLGAPCEERAAVVPAEHSPLVDQQVGLSPVNPFDPFDVTPSPIGGLSPSNTMRKGSGAASASSSAAALKPSSRQIATNGDAYPYIHANGAAEHSAPAASAPMQSPPSQQSFNFSQPQWNAASGPAVAAAGGPRADQYSDPFANASVNPFDDLDEFSSLPATPAQAAQRKVSTSSSHPSSLPESIPEYHPAPYVPPPAPVVEAAPAPTASVVMLGDSELVDAVAEVDGDTDEAAEGAVPGEEEELEGVPSAATVAAAAAVPVPAPAPASAPAMPRSASPAPPVVAPAAQTPPLSSFAALHSASAPRPPPAPVRFPSAMPPSPPASRPPPPPIRQVQWVATVAPPHSPQSAKSDNPFDDD